MKTKQQIDVESIKELVESFYGFDLNSKRRHRELVYAKRVFSKICRDNGYIYREIAKALDCEHANVINHINSFGTVDNIDLRIYNKINKVILNTDLADTDSLNFKALIYDYEAKIDKLEARLSLKDVTEENGEIKSILLWDKAVIDDFVATRLKPYKLINKLD